MSQGAKLGMATETTVQTSDAGPRYFNVQPQRRIVAFTIQHLDEDEALTEPFEMQRQLGLDGQFLFVWDPDDGWQAFRRSFLATLRELTPLEAATAFLFDAAFAAEEVL
jgi:hypothetical protein